MERGTSLISQNNVARTKSLSSTSVRDICPGYHSFKRQFRW